MRDTIRAMDVIRKEGRIRGFGTKMRTLSKPEEDGDVKGAERHEIRKNAERKRQTETPPICPSEGDPTPEPVR